MPIYDAQGRPMRKAEETVLDAYARLGVTEGEQGKLEISKSALKRFHDQEARKHAVTSVPSTPRYVLREVGQAVGKGHGLFNVMTMGLLRDIREKSPLIQSIHAARQAQIRRFSRRWSGQEGAVGWEVVHKRHYDKDFQVPPEFMETWIPRADALLAKPSPRYCPHGSQAMAQLLDDYLTLNRPTVEFLHSLWDQDYLVGWRPVDGSLVWPTLEWLEKWVARNPDRVKPYSDLSVDELLNIASESIDHDLHGAAYCVVRDFEVEAVYGPHDLLIGSFVNRTDVTKAGYPPSHVEQAIHAIIGFINAFGYNETFFTRGMLNEVAFAVVGDVHPREVQALRDTLREATQGVARAHQPPVIHIPVQGGLERIDLRTLPTDTLFDSFMSLCGSLACAIYRMDPSEINWKPWDGGGGSSLTEPRRDKEIGEAKEQGLIGDLEHMAEAILTPIVQRVHPDLIVRFETGQEDSRGRAETLSIRTKTTLTRNEARLREGLEPIGFYVDAKDVEALEDEEREKYEANPWNMPTDPAFAQVKQAADQQRMMEQQQQMGPEGGPFGAPPDDQGGEFPYGEADPYDPFGQAGGDPMGGGMAVQPEAPPSPGGGMEGMVKAQNTRRARRRARAARMRRRRTP